MGCFLGERIPDSRSRGPRVIQPGGFREALQGLRGAGTPGSQAPGPGARRRSKNPRLAVSSLLLTLLPTTLAGSEVRDISRKFEIADGQRLRLEIPVGDIEIEASDRTQVEVELTVRCRWSLADCRHAVEQIELAERSTAKRLTVELSGLSRWRGTTLDIEGTILVPHSTPLDVEMGVAELDVTGVEQDLRIEIGVGQVRVWMSEERIGRALLDVGVGEVELLGAPRRASARRSFLVGNEVHWDDGPGQARVDIEVGVGEITLWLD